MNPRHIVGVAATALYFLACGAAVVAGTWVLAVVAIWAYRVARMAM